MELPKNILDLIDVSKAGLERVQSAAKELDVLDKDFRFDEVNLRTDSVDFDEDEPDDAE